jgi:hypothetical protein
MIVQDMVQFRVHFVPVLAQPSLKDSAMNSMWTTDSILSKNKMLKYFYDAFKMRHCFEEIAEINNMCYIIGQFTEQLYTHTHNVNKWWGAHAWIMTMEKIMMLRFV